MKTTVWYLLVICLIKVKEMVNYIFAELSLILIKFVTILYLSYIIVLYLGRSHLYL